jgi:hypothetical protein
MQIVRLITTRFTGVIYDFGGGRYGAAPNFADVVTKPGGSLTERKLRDWF